MAKQIIALDKNQGDVGFFNLRVAFWFPVAAGKEVPVPGLNSSAYNGASAAEINSLALGSVVEVVRNFSFPTNTTGALIKSTLDAAYASVLASLPVKGDFYGIFRDSVGSTWSV